MARQRKEKWEVYGQYGGRFTNLKDAHACAKEASIAEPDEEVGIYNIEEYICYIDYLNGKCIRDGWKRARA